MNILLDALPDEYHGYLIRPDFRIGAQICIALEDNELTNNEKAEIAISLLFGNGAPPIQEAINGVQWYLKGGVEKPPEDGENEPHGANNAATEGENEDDGDGARNFSFEVDAGRIYTAFRRAYGIDLNTAQLHWFAFLDMLRDLPDCAFTQVIEIRTKNMGDVPKAQRGRYARLKEKYALPEVYTVEEQEKIDEFMTAFNGGRK